MTRRPRNAVYQGIKVSRYQGIKVSRYQGIKVSRYQGIKVSRYQGIKVSRYQGIKVSRYQGIKVSRYQGIKVSRYQGIKVSRYQGIKHPRIECTYFHSKWCTDCLMPLGIKPQRSMARYTVTRGICISSQPLCLVHAPQRRLYYQLRFVLRFFLLFIPSIVKRK